jgi:hypothetical protein
MQIGTGPGGVSPELFNPAEFMGSPLNEMAQAPGFFPQGNFGGGPSPSENEGILSGFADEEEMVDEVMPFQFPYTQELFDAAKTEALKLFDQGFKELMAIFQAETAAGGVAAEEIEMTLDEELEVLEGQAEAQVKEMMDLPEEVDLIPAEVVENYRQKAQTALFSPEMGAEPMMEEIPRMMSAGVVQGSVLEEEEEDPLAILEAQRAAATDRLDERKRIAAGEAAAREEALQGRIRTGDFNVLSEEERKVNWEKLDEMVARVRDVARREAEEETHYSPGSSGAWLGALVRSPRMGKLAGDKAALDFEIEIEKLKQAERQAINTGNSQMLRDVYIQGQKIQDALTNTLLGDVGDIEAKAITGVEDILTKQIGDEGYTDTWRTDQYWLSVLEDPNSTDLQKRVAEQALGIGTGKGDVPTRTAEFVKLANASWKGYKKFDNPMSVAEKKAEFKKEYGPLIEFYGKDVFPTDPNFYEVVQAYIKAQSVGAPATQTPVIDVSNLSKEQVQEAISKGFYPSGTTLKTDAGQITVP